MRGALEGIRILDLSRYISGPYCAMMLGDMGADVIKIEKSGKGEDARGLDPFKNGKSLYYTSYNKNKRSITLNFRSKEGIAVLKELMAESDVLIENFRPGTLEKMGLDKDEIERINPRLIVASISGFGQDGPYRDRAAFDCIAQAMSGLMSITGTEEGGPMLAGTYIADFVAALYTAFGITVALYSRNETGKGQFLDVSLLDGLYSILATAAPLMHANGIRQKRAGNRDKVCAPATAFKGSDGYIYIHGGTDPLFSRLVRIMGREDLLEDERFSKSVIRMQHAEEIESIVQDWLKDKTVDEIEALMVEAGIPAGPVNDMKRVLDNEQLKHREAIAYTDYPEMGTITVPGVVVKMSETPGKISRRPPTLGEHTDEILTQILHYTQGQIQELKMKGVL